jgi:hypothetical protein
LGGGGLPDEPCDCDEDDDEAMLFCAGLLSPWFGVSEFCASATWFEFGWALFSDGAFGSTDCRPLDAVRATSDDSVGALSAELGRVALAFTVVGLASLGFVGDLLAVASADGCAIAAVDGLPFCEDGDVCEEAGADALPFGWFAAI